MSSMWASDARPAAERRPGGGGEPMASRTSRAFSFPAVASAVLFGCASVHPVRTPLAAAVTPITAAASPVANEPHGETFSSKNLGFALNKPPGDSWAIATNVTSPDGRPIPLVVAHPTSGAQIVVQVSQSVERPKELADLLRQKLQSESTLALGQPQRLSVDSGREAYGFDFQVKGQADGRVAIIDCGDRVVLVVASWPKNAAPGIVRDIDGVVRSVRRAGDVNPAMLWRDKA